MALHMGRQIARGGRQRVYAGKDFEGVVIDDNDPEKKERIKVRIKGVHDDLTDKQIPWTSASRNGAPASGGSMGSVGPIPKKGTAVRVKYADDTMYYGTYSAASLGEKQQSSELFQGQDTTGKSYPQVTSSIDSSGNRLTVNNEKDTFDYEHVSGTRISLDGQGRMAIVVGDKKVGENAEKKHEKGLTLHITGPVNIRSTENVNIGSDKDVNIVAKQHINIACGGNYRTYAKGTVHIDGKTVDLNDGSGTMPKLKELQEPPSRSRPNPNLQD